MSRVNGSLLSLKSSLPSDGPDVIRISVLRHSKYHSNMSHSGNECLRGSTRNVNPFPKKDFCKVKHFSLGGEGSTNETVSLFNPKLLVVSAALFCKVWL